MAAAINRREFLILAAATVAGCRSAPTGTGPGMSKIQLINAGPASDYAADGVYSRYWASGFFIVRWENQLLALSSICTHRRCRLTAQPDHSLACPCHGSTFNPAGHVTGGPAKRNLPVLETFTNERGELLIKVPVV
jgi:Rieske Fe-S protein